MVARKKIVKKTAKKTTKKAPAKKAAPKKAAPKPKEDPQDLNSAPITLNIKEDPDPHIIPEGPPIPLNVKGQAPGPNKVVVEAKEENKIPAPKPEREFAPDSKYGVKKARELSPALRKEIRRLNIVSIHRTSAGDYVVKYDDHKKDIF